MHHYKADNGTHFNFNSDLSGDIHIHREPDDAVACVSGHDLKAFILWWMAEYEAPETENF